MHTEFIIVHAQITILCKFHWARACVASVLRAIAVGNLHAWSGKSAVSLLLLLFVGALLLRGVECQKIPRRC